MKSNSIRNWQNKPRLILQGLGKQTTAYAFELQKHICIENVHGKGVREKEDQNTFRVSRLIVLN